MQHGIPFNLCAQILLYFIIYIVDMKLFFKFCRQVFEFYFVVFNFKTYSFILVLQNNLLHYIL